MTYYKITFASRSSAGKFSTWKETQEFDNDAEAVFFASFICESDDPGEATTDEYLDYLSEYYAQTGEKLDITEVSDMLDETNTLCPGGIVCLSVCRIIPAEDDEYEEAVYTASEKIQKTAQ